MYNYNWINVYDMIDYATIKVYKTWRIPPEVETDDDVMLTLFHKHLTSPVFTSDTNPYFIIPVRMGGGRNALVIDPTAPLLESMPTLLLPRQSDASSFMIFPYTITNSQNYRQYSVGILHWVKNLNNAYRDESRPYYLFQLFKPDRPKIYLTTTQQGVFSVNTIYSPYEPPQAILNQFFFQSMLSMVQDPPNFDVFTASIGITQRKPVHTNTTSTVLFYNNTVSLAEAYNRSQGNSPLQLYTRRFRDLYTGTVFEWVVEPEGFFDGVVGTFSFKQPMERVSEYKLENLKELIAIDGFCYKYSIVNGTLKCSKTGWALHFTSQIKLFYQEKLEALDLKKYVSFKFDPNECTRSLVSNDSLLTFCQRGLIKNIYQTSIIDLNQKAHKQNMLNLEPLNAEPKIPQRPITDIYSDYIFEYARLNTDSLGISRISQLYYFYCSLKFEKTLKNSCLSPFNYTTSFVKAFDASVNTEGSGVTYQPQDSKGRMYRFSSILLNTGNLVVGQIIQSPWTEGYLDKPNIGASEDYFTDGSSPNAITTIDFGFESPKEVKKVTLDRSLVDELIFNDTDPIQTTGSTFQRFTMITLPSFHSYLVRHSGPFHVFNLSIYKIENPFAELKNEFWNSRPVCMRWACLFFSEFGGKQFIRIYDFSPETLLTKSMPPNFREIFEQDIGPNNNPLSFYNFDRIPTKYTFSPIQVYNVTNFRLAKFVPTKEESPNQLKLLLFFNDDTVQVMEISRNFTLNSSNLYFGSRWVSFRGLTTFSTVKTFYLNIIEYTERDYFKYFVLVFCAIFGGFVTVCISLRILVSFDKRTPLKRRTKSEAIQDEYDIMNPNEALNEEIDGAEAEAVLEPKKDTTQDESEIAPLPL
jgi:hypothetical protein